MTLPPRQSAALQFVADHTAAKGFPPTSRELARWLGISDTAARCLLGALERKKMIARTAGLARSTVILRKCETTKASEHVVNSR